MTYTTRDLVYIGVFAACWSALEVTLGALLHALRLPFLGAVMAGLGIGIALVGRLYVPRTGSVFFMALVTALLKLLSVAGPVLSPLVAITAEGLVAEALVLMLGPRKTGFVLAAGAASLYALAHAFGRVWLTGGNSLIESYLTIVNRGATAMGLSANWPLAVFIGLVAVHVLIGGICGLLAWRVGQGLRRRGRSWADQER